MKTYLKLLLLTLILAYSCTNNINKDINDITKIKTANIKYAKGFKIDYFDNYKLITLFNPWDNYSVYYKYKIFYDNVKYKSQNLQLEFSVVKNRIIALSGSQIGFLAKLNLADSVNGISKKQYIYNKSIIKNIESGKTVELGDETSLDYEKIVAIKPKIVFVTGWNKINSSFDKLIVTGIPIVYMLEWQEQNPLGRAEWIKFIAAFFNKEQEADSLFLEVEKNYLKIKEYKNITKKKPTVLHGSLIAGTWYVPGGDSYIANLYADAGANYIWKNIKKTGSIALKFESVYTKAKNVDFWFPMIDIKNTSDLNNIEKRYKLFNPYYTHKIFLSNKRQNFLGGNDYWESGVANPDIIIKDLNNIFYKDSVKNEELFFFSKIY